MMMPPRNHGVKNCPARNSAPSRPCVRPARRRCLPAPKRTRHVFLPRNRSSRDLVAALLEDAHVVDDLAAGWTLEGRATAKHHRHAGRGTDHAQRPAARGSGSRRFAGRLDPPIGIAQARCRTDRIDRPRSRTPRLRRIPCAARWRKRRILSSRPARPCRRPKFRSRPSARKNGPRRRPRRRSSGRWRMPRAKWRGSMRRSRSTTSATKGCAKRWPPLWRPGRKPRRGCRNFRSQLDELASEEERKTNALTESQDRTGHANSAVRCLAAAARTGGESPAGVA